MMNQKRSRNLQFLAIASLVVFGGLFYTASPALAHHAMGGKMPANFFEGLITGIAHPIIGFDHFAFVVAVGLFAALNARGVLIPIAFILTSLAGTGIHLMKLDLPIVELVVSGSVLAFGVMLAMRSSPNIFVLTVLSAIAGIFHGYAYGESIVGAETAPLFAYLTGFAFIQLVIALIAAQIGKFVLKSVAESPQLIFRFAGFTICGVGGAFFASNLSKLVFGM